MCVLVFTYTKSVLPNVQFLPNIISDICYESIQHCFIYYLSCLSCVCKEHVEESP